jgi:hydrogenase-4 membrane subunit HyfE
MTFQDLMVSTEAVITRTDAASALHCDPRLISRGIRENKIPHITLGRRVLILRAPFVEMLMATDWRTQNEI